MKEMGESKKGSNWELYRLLVSGTNTHSCQVRTLSRVREKVERVVRVFSMRMVVLVAIFRGIAIGDKTLGTNNE